MRETLILLLISIFVVLIRKNLFHSKIKSEIDIEDLMNRIVKAVNQSSKLPQELHHKPIKVGEIELNNYLPSERESNMF